MVLTTIFNHLVQQYIKNLKSKMTMKNIFLHPGEIAFSSTESRIITILGSCIAVCIYDNKLKTGGMCHYYLPRSNDNISTSNKYGINAIPNLLKKFKVNGSNPSDLVAKIVGGAHVLDSIPKNKNVIGPDNIKIAEELLEKFGIKIEAKSTGGYKGKKIRLYSDSGKVELQEFKGIPDEDLIEHPENDEQLAQSSSIKNNSIFKKSPQQDYNKNTPARRPQKGKKISVMVIDDSKTMREILKRMINIQPDMQVVQEAADASEAEKLLESNLPDVITLDINMPGVDGVTLLKKYMKKHPIPTVMISAISFSESGPVFEALEHGAFDYMKKPAFEEIESCSSELHDKIRAAFDSKYIEKKEHIHHSNEKKEIVQSSSNLTDYIVAIGASTGGTEAIKDILVQLPSNIPPIVITQHIPPVFSAAFADRLNQLCSFSVKEASNGDILKPGRAFVAPGGKHIKIITTGKQHKIELSEDPPVNRFRPSVDYMFDSIAKKSGPNVLAVLLTGMGSDGAKGLLDLKNKGAMTIAQDESTSIVYGMPKAAKDLGAAMKILPLDKIASHMAKHINTKFC